MTFLTSLLIFILKGRTENYLERFTSETLEGADVLYTIISENNILRYYKDQKYIYLCNKALINENLEQITRLDKTEGLEILDNVIEDLPSSFTNFKNLKLLKIVRAELSSIPCVIFDIKSLKLLDLSENNIEVIPDGILQLIDLETLNLETNNIYKIFDKFYQTNITGFIATNNPRIISSSENPEEIEKDGKEFFCKMPKSLEQLILNNTKLSFIPENDFLKHATILSIVDGYLSTLPTSLTENTVIKGLYLDNNKYEIIPKEIIKSNSLIHLRLSENEITNISFSSDDLPSLRLLNLHKNKLTQFSLSQGGLPQLENLVLNSNQLTEIKFSTESSNPPQNGLMEEKNTTYTSIKIKYLYLDDNKFEHLTAEIMTLPELVSLNLEKNDIKTIDDISDNSGILHIQYLHITLHNLDVIVNLFKLKTLNSLVVKCNNENFEISEDVIFSELGNLNHLRTLGLSHCGIKKIPIQIISLEKLNHLNLSNNIITKFPDMKFYGEKVYRINLSYNKITSIKDYIISDTLRFISLRKNNIKYLPKEINSIKGTTMDLIRNPLQKTSIDSENLGKEDISKEALRLIRLDDIKVEESTAETSDINK